MIEHFYRGQRYVRQNESPYIRDDGTKTKIAEWETECATCGEPFVFATTAKIRHLRWPPRRCKKHRQPGVKVAEKNAC
jgi:hypothetical protein